MQIRHLKIRNFRGIKELDWAINGDFVCLIGPGDSTKSTILNAIEFALSPRWNLPFDDTDFHNVDISESILIEVTVGELPNELKSDGKFGLEIRGWSGDGDLHDEPEKGDEFVLTVRLTVDSSLEPRWTVVNERNPEGTRISSRDREQLGVSRLGSFLNRDLSWARGTVLSRLTGSAEELPSILAEITRAARKAFPSDRVESICGACTRARKLAVDFAVACSTDGYKPNLDIQNVAGGAGGVALHDGDVPLRLAGLGTCRLITLGLQSESRERGGIVLIDEVEHGLEPHRIRHLIQVLKREQKGQDPNVAQGQVIMTTHSPVVIEELKARELHVIRNVEGVTDSFRVSSDLQDIVRGNPSAFLARSILVCEGKTEVGLCRALNEEWQKEKPETSFGIKGIVPINGGGSDAPKVAIAFAGMGYDVALLRDSDRALDSDTLAELESFGIRMIEWVPNQRTGNGTCIEQRICLDLPRQGLVEVLLLAVKIVDERGTERATTSVRDSVAHWARSISTSPISTMPEDDPNAWWDLLGEKDFRRAVGKAAHKGTWFKRIDRGQELGEIVVKYLDQIPEKDLADKIGQLRKWTNDKND